MRKRTEVEEKAYCGRKNIDKFTNCREWFSGEARIWRTRTAPVPNPRPNGTFSAAGLLWPFQQGNLKVAAYCCISVSIIYHISSNDLLVR